MKKICLTFHYTRCGSTALSSALKLHPDIAHAGELFNWAAKWNEHPIGLNVSLHDQAEISLNDAERIFENFLSLGANRGKLASFFEVTTWDLHRKVIGFPVNDFLDYIREKHSAEIYIIHLQRLNQLRLFLSSEMARETGVYHISGPEYKTQRIRLDVPRLLTSIESTLIWRKRMNEMFSQYDRVLDLFYESDIAENIAIAIHKTLDFVIPGCADFEGGRGLLPATRKMGSENLAEVIENFDEVRSALANRGLQWMLQSGLPSDADRY